MIPLLLLLLACGDDADEKTPPEAETGEGLLLGGCPVEGQAVARALTDPAERPWGPDALATPGDALLLSEAAAFVISAPEDPQTYYHYGGIPIDAVALDGCAQSGPELLGEIGFAIGRLELSDFAGSVLRQFRGESMEIVNDGADGEPAVVEVHGTDGRFWLVEMTLIRQSYEDGTPRALQDLYGLDVTVRYTLAPGSDVLEVEVLLDGEPAVDGFLVGGLLFPSDLTELEAFSTSELSFGGFGLDTGVPWISMGGPLGSQAVAMPGAGAALTTVAGVTAMLDVGQALSPLEVTAPGGADPVPFLISVSAGDPARAGAALEPWLDTPITGRETAWADLDGALLDPAGAPVAGAEIRVLASDDDGEQRLLDRLITGEDGAFSGRLLDVGGDWRLVATADGRDDAEAVDVDPAAATGLTLEIGPVGSVQFAFTDEDGAAIPARVELERADGLTAIRYAIPGEGAQPLPPGSWTAWVSRGYEAAIVETTLEVPEDGTATLSATLETLLDTTGWASMDSHVHAGPSPDAETLPEERMRTAAAAGLDVVISTDHEAIVDLEPALLASGTDPYLDYGLGSEVTCTAPEHVNAWPFPAVDTQARGEPVVWYAQGFADVYAAIRARGASVIQLNHSRVNGECGVLCLLDWDRQSETPSMEDPSAIGVEDAEVWSWDFDSFEVMNGLRSPFLDPDDPRHTGALNDWMAFHNLGHRVTGVAVTDVHGPEIPGSPRTWVRVAEDAPGAVAIEDLAEGVLAGAAQLSAGAFLEVEIAGAGPGETVSTGHAPVIAVRAQALPEIDLTVVDVVASCTTLVTLEASDPDGVVKLDTSETLLLAEDAWVIVVARGEGAMPRGLEDYDATVVPRAITNPIFVDVDGDGVWTAPGAIPCAWTP